VIHMTIEPEANPIQNIPEVFTSPANEARSIRPSFSDGNHSAHVQLLLEWLPPLMKEIQGIDWTLLSSEAIAALLCAVDDSPYASSIALCAGSLISAVRPKTVAGYIRSLNRLLNALRKQCEIQNINELQNWDVWELFITKTTTSAERHHSMGVYSSLTERHVPDLLERLTPQQRNYLVPYVLPKLPPGFQRQHSIQRKLYEDTERRRKERSDVLSPLAPVLVALILHRLNAIRQMRDAYRQALYKVEVGQAHLPYTYEYEATLPEINPDAREIAEIRISSRQVRMQLTIWDPDSWIQGHPEDYSSYTQVALERGYEKHRQQTKGQFLQFHGLATDLFWFGDLVEKRVIRTLEDAVLIGQDVSYALRSAYARNHGFTGGVKTTRSGLLNPPGALGMWLSKLKYRPNELLFEPESLFIGTLFGAALSITALTSAARVSELLQISLDRFEMSSVEETCDGIPTGKKALMFFQLLLPKGSISEEERQIFPISYQSLLLLREITEELQAVHGEIPCVALSQSNAKADTVHPERFLFQWGANAKTGRGALRLEDVGTLMRFVLHGLELYTVGADRIKVTPHLLRHVMATAARHEYDVPLEAIAWVLHHRTRWNVYSAPNSYVPIATHYYSKEPHQNTMQRMFEHADFIEEQSGYYGLSVPDESSLARMDDNLRASFEKWHTLNPTPFGFCGRAGLCPRGNNRSLCIGCPYLVSNPAKRWLAKHWEELYRKRAETLHQSNLTDSRQSAKMAAQLRDLLNIMDLQDQAMQESKYVPLYVQLTEAT
jgi:hypothetical protein